MQRADRLDHRMRLRGGLAALLVVLGISIAVSARAEPEAVIYRCEHAGVIEFSDRPCRDGADDAERFDPEASSMSVISAADNLDEIQRENQAWLRDYRARQQADRMARSQVARDSRPPPRPVPAVIRTPVAPFFWNQRPQHHGPRYHPRGDIATPMSRQRPYSALSGPFPGTRRSDLRPSVPVEPDQ
jgi:hypothetical protein